MNLIGIDPGETTGVCFYSDLEIPRHDLALMVDSRWQYYMYAQLATNSPVGYYEFRNWLSYTASKQFGEAADVTVILERFEWRLDPEAKERTKISYVPAEVCGVVKEASHRFRYNLVEQSASQATGHKKGNEGAFWDDAKLKKLGLYVESKRHAMDALRHVLYFKTFVLKDTGLLMLLK